MSDKKIFSSSVLILISVFCSIMIISPVYAQKKPPRTVTVRDTTGAKKDSLTAEEAKKLPTLNLREYTITGSERVRVLPSQRRSIEMADYTRRERNTSIDSRTNRAAPGAGGQKIERIFETPLVGMINEAYVSLGKYNDANVGVKVRKKFTKDEFFANIDYHRSTGHVNFADFYDLYGDLAHIRSIAGGVRNKAQFSLNMSRNNFYGSLTNPGQIREGKFGEFNDVMDITRWEQVQFTFEAGGRYFDPDQSDYFNWDLWSRLNWKSVVKSTFIYGSFEANTDRVKKAISGNPGISTANYTKGFLAFERLLTKRLHLKAGISLINSKITDNADWEFSILRDTLFAGSPEVVDRGMNKIYPLVAVTYDFGEQGRFFIEYEPNVGSFTYLDKLRYNKYLNLETSLAYENVSHDLKIGWRRSYAYDLSFEIFYNDKRIENYGILLGGVGSLIGTEPAMDGVWTYDFDNVIDMNEYRGTVNWNPDPRFYSWLSLTFADYTVRKSDYADRLPYLPNWTADFQLQYMPGNGFQFILDGQFIDKRDTAPFNITNNGGELDSYFLSNLTVSKQWTKQIGGYVYLNNIFNEKFEVWQGYNAQDIMGGAGVRYFW